MLVIKKKAARCLHSIGCGLILRYRPVFKKTHFRLGPFMTTRFRAELTVGPALRLRAKVTVVEDPQAPPARLYTPLLSASRLPRDTLQPP